ncbi:MAG: HAD family hydrolase [Syntrophorhabdaceae bacterium]|nr:HAD family hydrolase [Syntrophorhabdaceae bacterium]
MKGIVFMDRDGTLIEDTGYLRDPMSVRILPGAADALRKLASKGYVLAVLSNQSGLARGIFTRDEMETVHRAFLEKFRAEGVVFDAVEYCPHHPEGVVEEYRKACSCRKPDTGLAEAVLRRLKVPDTYSRWMVGDKLSDIELGIRLKARTALVETGYGSTERKEGECLGLLPDVFLPGMRETVEWILSEDG